MFLRETRQKRADGSKVVYLQLVENQWDPEKKRSKTKILVNFGRADDPATIERLKRVARSLLRRAEPEALAEAEGWKLLDAWPYRTR